MNKKFAHSAYRRLSYVIGVDEVGRGSLAGPVAVGAVVFYKKLSRTLFFGVKDSKKLSPQKREWWYARITSARRRGLLNFCVAFSSVKVIDEKKIVYALKSALGRALERISPKGGEGMILLDGGLRAPVKYKNQKTIIKGDEKRVEIAVASIVAKVLRDRLMVKRGERFSLYGFGEHKGYGTKAHFQAIETYGTCELHRKSFLKNMRG